jgi:hypothetical protein
MPEIDLRFSPNGPLTRSTSDLGTMIFCALEYLPFCEFDCILPLVVCSHILHVVVLIAAMLHIISYNLIEAVSECQIRKLQL